MRLSNRTIVITGAAGLLGREHTKAVLENGGNAVLLDIDPLTLEEFKRELDEEFTERFRTFTCDITDRKALLRILSEITSDFGVPTGLINNAAINPSVERNGDRFNRIEDINKDAWNLEFDVGLWGAFECARIFGQAMIDNKLDGSIINISSDHGIMAPNQNLYKMGGVNSKNQPVKPITYSLIKHALIGLTRYLSTYWANDGIRVNTLCPGGVLNGQSESFLNKFNDLVPMGRPANPDEYRGAVVFMLSADSSYMTGATIVIDGGRSVW
jgi:NAD(P)-dependent dehydrogenase (short-subunit alcohol dehydrogenase family)